MNSGGTVWTPDKTKAAQLENCKQILSALNFVIIGQESKPLALITDVMGPELFHKRTILTKKQRLDCTGNPFMLDEKIAKYLRLMVVGSDQLLLRNG